MAGKNYLRPPINELAISASLASPTLFDPYDVRKFHELVRDEFPVIQRVDPIAGLEFDPVFGHPPLVADFPVSRWWFLSESGADIVQAQENFFARNWRRTVGHEEPPSYPGFNAVHASFQDAISRIRANSEVSGRLFPEPRSIEVMYDDVIPGMTDGTTFKLSSMLTTIKPLSPRPLAGWQNSWLEPIRVLDEEAAGHLQVQIAAAHVEHAETKEAKPVIRIVWRAAMKVDTWTKADAFIPAAHDYISKRFDEIISEECRVAWEAK